MGGTVADRSAVAGVEQVTDNEGEDVGAGREDRLESLNDAVVVGGNVIVVKQPATRQGRTTGSLGLEKINIEVEEGREGLGVPLIGNSVGGELSKHGGNNGIELGDRLSNGDKRLSAEGEGEELIVDIEPIVDKVVGPLVEDAGGVPVSVIVKTNVGVVDIEGGTGRRDIVKRLHGNGQDDGKSRRTTALESPEKIRVLGLIGSDKVARRCDGLKGENIVGRKTLERSPWTVATALDEATSNTNGWAFASNNHLGRNLSMALLQDGAALDTGSNGHGRTRVRAGTGIRRNPVDILEAVGVDDQGTGTGAAADKVVAGVADDQADVVATSKVNAGLDVVAGGGRDDINAIVAQRAAVGGIESGPAGLVGEVCPEGGTRLLNTNII